MSRIKKQSDDTAYRNYIADALMIITENTDRSQNSYRHLIKRYSDTAKEPEKKDNRTGKSIAADIIKSITKKG